jgi:ribose 5-phosphate isomerase A
VADSSKIVDRLGRKHPVPVEVIPYGWRVPRNRIDALGGRPVLRTNADGSPFVTDNGNYILDVAFGPIDDPAHLAATLKSLTGVVDHGLFIDIAERALVATDGDVREYRHSLHP